MTLKRVLYSGVCPWKKSFRFICIRNFMNYICFTDKRKVCEANWKLLIQSHHWRVFREVNKVNTICINAQQNIYEYHYFGKIG